MAEPTKGGPLAEDVAGPRRGAGDASAGRPSEGGEPAIKPGRAPTPSELDERERRLIERRPPAGPPLPEPDLPPEKSQPAPPPSEPEQK